MESTCVRLKGCYPQDINNWFLWSNLWKNFSFPTEIPYGISRFTGFGVRLVIHAPGIVDAKDLSTVDSNQKFNYSCQG